jgi:hypothetical protein
MNPHRSNDQDHPPLTLKNQALVCSEAFSKAFIAALPLTLSSDDFRAD